MGAQQTDVPTVIMTNAGLDDDSGEIILRGVLHPTTLHILKVDNYQRETLPIAKLLELTEAFRHGSVPDIDLGMRGGNYSEQAGVYTLRDPIYIIDGLQRRTAALEAMKSGCLPRLGATLHFNTTMEWERRRFRILNVAQTKLSPNVLLRNMYLEGSVCLDLLHGLTLDSSFPLCRKVSWDQRQHKEHLLTALALLKASATLHSSFQGGLRDTNHHMLVEAFDKFVTKTGHSLVRNNLLLYWNVVDECFGIRNIEVKNMAAQIRASFLSALGTLITNHSDFWADRRLIVNRELRKKLTSFPIHDPNIAVLCGAGGGTGGAKRLLYQLLVDHINSGKRTRRLTPKKLVTPDVQEFLETKFEPTVELPN